MLFPKLKWGCISLKNHIRSRPISKYPMSKTVLGCTTSLCFEASLGRIWSNHKSLFKAHYSLEFYEIVSCNWPLSIITVREHIPILILKTEIYTISVVSFLNWFLISVRCMPLIQQEILLFYFKIPNWFSYLIQTVVLSAKGMQFYL